MNADEARKKAQAVRDAQEKEIPKIDYMSREDLLKLIEKAASEGKTSVKFYKEISEETQNELHNMGYWVLPGEIRFED